MRSSCYIVCRLVVLPGIVLLLFWTTTALASVLHHHAGRVPDVTLTQLLEKLPNTTTTKTKVSSVPPSVMDDSHPAGRVKAILEESLHFDLSGQVNVHIMGPAQTQEDTISLPLVGLGSFRWCPNWFLGIRYSLGPAMAGISHVVSSCQWSRQPFALDRPSSTTSLLPLSITLHHEQPLSTSHVNTRSDNNNHNNHGNDNATARSALTLQWDSLYPMTLSAHYTPGHETSVSVVVPLWRRVLYEHLITSKSQFDRMPPITLSKDPTNVQLPWWIPQVTLRPSGLVQASNDVCWNNPFRRDNNNNNSRLHVRLIARRRLEWSGWLGTLGNVFGSHDHDESSVLSMIGLQVQDMTLTSRTGVMIETALEYPRQGLRVAIQQQTCMPSLWSKG